MYIAQDLGDGQEQDSSNHDGNNKMREKTVD